MRHAAITWCCRACAERSGRAGSSSRWLTKPTTAPTRWCGCASNPGSPVGSPPSDCRTWDSPSGHCCRIRRRNWPRPSSPWVRTISTPRCGAPARSRSTTFWAGAIWFPARRTRGASKPEFARCGPRGESRRPLVKCRWESRPGNCSALVHPGSNRGPSTPSRTIRSGTGYGSPTRWRRCGCRCCSWVAGRTFSCGRRCSNTGTCAAAMSTLR